MIFYFTGTGNSLAAAKALLQPGERLISMAEALRDGEVQYTVSAGEAVGFVFPVYFYTLPTVVSEFAQRLSLVDATYVYSIITCGGSIKQAGSVLKKKLAARGIELNYVRELVMPDNSMLFYQIPDSEKAQERLPIAKKQLSVYAQEIAARKQEVIGNRTVISDLLAKAYEKSRKTEKFYAESTCISCGLCEANCPQGAIKLVAKKPQWIRTECCKCSGCINRCPVQAIQYGRATKKRNRYVHPDF